MLKAAFFGGERSHISRLSGTGVHGFTFTFGQSVTRGASGARRAELRETWPAQEGVKSECEATNPSHNEGVCGKNAEY